MPLFIAEYLSQLLPKIKVRTFVKIRPTIDGKIQEGDIDVYIKKSQTGFECKNFLNPTPAETQMRGYVDEVFEELGKYVCAGVKRVIVVTNLSEKDTQSMNEKVLLKLEEKNLSPDLFEVLSDSVQKLLILLESEAKQANL